MLSASIDESKLLIVWLNFDESFLLKITPGSCWSSLKLLELPKFLEVPEVPGSFAAETEPNDLQFTSSGLIWFLFINSDDAIANRPVEISNLKAVIRTALC